MAFHKKRILMALKQDSDSDRNLKREAKLMQRNCATYYDDNESYNGDDESQDKPIVKKRIISKIINNEVFKLESLKKSLEISSEYLEDFSKSALKISISDYSKKNEDLVNLLDSHVNILNYIYDIMELIIKCDASCINDHFVPSSEKNEINELFWNLINYNCVNDMIIDIIDQHQKLDPENKIKKEIINNNNEYIFPISFIITMCKCLRHICAFEMLLNPLVL
jgi:hypothetical protein